MLRKLLALLSDAAIYGASSVISQIIGFLLLPLYTKYLTPEDYGVIAMLAIATALFGPVAQMGMTSAVFRYFNSEEGSVARGTVMSTGLASVMVTSLLLLGIGILFSENIARWIVGGGQWDSLVRISLWTAAISSVGAVPLATLRVRRRVKTIAVFSILKLICTVLLTVWLVVTKQMGVAGFVIAMLVGESVFTALQLGWTVQDFRYKPSFAMWRSMFGYGWPLVPHALQGVALSMFGIYVIKNQLGLEDAGLYNVALKFVVPLAFVVSSIQKSWVPYKFQIHATDRDAKGFFRTATTYYVAGITYLWIGVALWGPEALRIMTTPDFHAAANLIGVVGLISVSQGIYFMMGTGIEFGDTRKMPIVSLAGLVSVVLLSYRMVPALGAAGAAIATSAGMLIMAAAILALARKYYPIPYDWPAMIILGIAASVVVLTGYLDQGMPVLTRVAIAAVLSVFYPVLVLVVLLKSPTERSRMRMLCGMVWSWGSAARQERFG